MYDPWGVGEAIQHGMRMYSHGKRATGRSTLLLNSVKDGDTIVFAFRAEAQRMRRLLLEAEKSAVNIIVHDPNQGLHYAADFILERYNRKGQIYFDHTWFEALYLYEMQSLMHGMDRFKSRLDEMHVQADLASRSSLLRSPDELGTYNV